MSRKPKQWRKSRTNAKLFDYLIEKTKDAVSPLNLTQVAREFKENSGAAETTIGLVCRIKRLRSKVHEMIHIDMDTKMKLLFALSVPISNYYLEYLKNRAEIILDDHQRIIKYRKYGGGLELEGTHTIIRKKRETIQRDERMMEFFAQKARNVDSPITDFSFAREFKKEMGATERIGHLVKRYNLFKRKIHKSTDFDEKTKIRMLFVSSASVPIDFLEILRKDALVDVDEKNRITKYRANDGSLELQGDHSRSAKNRTGQTQRSQSYWKQITDYYKNRKAENEEMGNLIQFITEKCKSVDSPLSARQLAKEFSDLSGNSTGFACPYERIKGYCREIQKLDVLDTPTKVRQLFGLGGVLNDNFLKKRREEAFVEVDHRNRIIKYAANDGSLTLKGSHRGSRKAEKDMVTVDGPDEEIDKKGLNDDNDEYSSGESDSELESDNENDLDGTGDYMESSKEAEINADYGSFKTRSRRSAGTDIPQGSFENEKEPKTVTTRSGRVSKKRNLDAIVSPQRRDSNRKRTSKKSSKRIKNSETDELENYDPSSNDFQIPEVKLEPFRGSLIDGFISIDPEDDINVIPKPELREPKKEIEEEPIKIEIMEFPIKTEEDFLIPKQEELEEEDIKPELFC